MTFAVDAAWVRRLPGWSYLQGWWTAHATTVLRCAIVFMAGGASVRLFNESRRLLFEPGRSGAVDLRLRYGDVWRWFSGLPVYTDWHHAGYPPASHVLLWPFVGWMGEWQARWLWGVFTLGVLAILTALAIRESRATTRLERWFVALIFLSTYPAPITIGNGQLGIAVLTAMLCGLLLIRPERQANWRDDLVAGALLLFATVKPSVSAPLFWIALFVPGRLRPMALVAASYGLLTLLAISFQPDPVVKLLRDLTRVSAEYMAMDPTPSLAAWMSLLGLQAWMLYASSAVLALSGCWVYLNRRTDFWVLFAVASLVGRLWTYHHLYDDLLLFPAMITLFRIAKCGEPGEPTTLIAGLLLAVTLAGQLAPGRLQAYPYPWYLLYVIGEPVTWLTVLLFLVGYSRAQRAPIPAAAACAAGA